MLRIATGFVAGAWLFHQLAAIPAAAWLPGEFLLLLTLVSLRRRVGPMVVVLSAAMCGFGISHVHALASVPPSLASAGSVIELLADGRIVSLVERDAERARFVFEVDHVRVVGTGTDAMAGGESRPVDGVRVRVSWYQAPGLQPGQRWQLPLRVRDAHGYASPGSWDYEGWLYWQGIRHVGYVFGDAPRVQLAEADGPSTLRLRQAVLDALDRVELSAFARGVLGAITVGDRDRLDATAREVLQQTGTMHLVAISGLHVTLVAALGLGLGGALWRLVPALCNRVPARIVGLLAGLVLAFLYAQLAGFGLPTQRALVMLAALSAAIVLRTDHGLVGALAIAAIAVVGWHPPSVVNAGFWLSFGAVATIAAVIGHSRGRPWWQRTLMVHLALSLSLWPALAVFGLPAASVGPLANFVSIPLFGFLVVPLALAGVVVSMPAPGFGGDLLHLAGTVLDPAFTGLQWLAALSWPDLAAQALPPAILVAAMTALVLLLAPPGNPLRWVALPLLLVALAPRQSRLPGGAFELHALDVGQGLSVVVVTAGHVLVYDTGPEYRSGFSTAEAVLLPFLRERGVDRIDRLVLSHGDQDHAGGVERLAAAIDIGDIVSGEPDRTGTHHRRCHDSDGWRWDGVSFEVLHPSSETPMSGNDASCVLRVDNGDSVVLLTGDIEDGVERRLVEARPESLRSDVVFAPHHGSNSSSSQVFVDAVAPIHVVYSAGWANRYGFPTGPVRARWQAVNAHPLNTAELGTVSFRFVPGETPSAPHAHRHANARFWHHRGSADTGLAVSSRD
ncbi:MAG: DNA internalization-related competence protein ComEC/Rec2 [Gammaproteobacteria bacterium]|nr:DNA internalization-related competence protein ComEC/Rec2 [Gammaproteobacteria bacterium]